MAAKSRQALSPGALRSILDQLSLAVFVFRGPRLLYANSRATRLVTRLRTKYRIELIVMLLDHLVESAERPQSSRATIALTGHDNEPFVVHLMALPGRHGDMAVTIREIGTDIAAFQDGYGLSSREIEVAELVLRGCSNRQIGAMLGITPATTKKHLSRIFGKVGVDSRAQLSSKLA
jgi:DNA-binding CsgD family transcriptional regulator